MTHVTYHDRLVSLRADANTVWPTSVDYGWRLRSARLADPALTSAERETIIAKARAVREAAEEVCGLLADAVAAYERGDLAGVVAKLRAASWEENEHGDDPTTAELARRLLVVVD